MNPTNTYFDQHVLSADPVNLVRMLFQKAISRVQDARRYLVSGEIEKRSQAINKTYEILLEFVGSLNDEAAPELCANLRRLYCYMQQRLLDANLQQQDEPLSEVLALLTTLSEAWKAVPAYGSDSRSSGTPESYSCASSPNATLAHTDYSAVALAYA